MGKSFLVICSGLYVELANALAEGGKNKVYYLTCNESAFPKYSEYAPGHQFEYLEKVRLIDIAKYAEKVDGIVTFDTGTNGLITLLKKMYPTKCVFGAGVGEKLETNRIAFKNVLDGVGLRVIPYEVIKGYDALIKYLKANPKKVVKVDANFRGDFETLVIPDYNSVKQVLHDRRPNFGIYGEEIEFIVEDMVECVSESGYDGFYSNGLYLPFSYGVEWEKNTYLGRVAKAEEDVPEVLMDTLDGMRPILEKMDYRGALSTEERIVSEREHYFIDPCCRCPLPLGVLYSKYIKNWTEFVYQIGKGDPVPVECDFNYVGAYALRTSNAKDYFTLVNFEKGKRDDFRFMMACQNKDGEYYGVKGQEYMIVSVAAGETPEEVVDTLKESADDVNAFGLETDAIKGIDGILEKIENAKAVGLDF